MGFQQLLGVGSPPASAGPFDPSTISGLVSWYDAQSFSTLTLSGAQVTGWNDKGSAGVNTSQGSFLQQPAYSANGFNTSFPAVVYSSTQQNLFAGSSAISTLTEMTFFLVGNCLNPTSVPFAYAAGGPSSLDLGFGISASVMAQFYNAATPQTTTGNSIASTDLFYITYQRNTSGSNGFRKNGVAGSSTTATPTSLSIGSNTVIGNDGFGDGWTGAICEILFYNRALNGTEVGQVETYAKARWGL